MEGLFGKDRVCGVVAAGTAREMKSQMRLGLQTTRTLELRLDYLRDAKERAAFLSWLGRERTCGRADRHLPEPAGRRPVSGQPKDAN